MSYIWLQKINIYIQTLCTHFLRLSLDEGLDFWDLVDRAVGRAVETVLKLEAGEKVLVGLVEVLVLRPPPGTDIFLLCVHKHNFEIKLMIFMHFLQYHTSTFFNLNLFARDY